MKRLKTITRSTLTGFMVMWLSGVVFLILCHGQKANTMESCPLVKLGAHCDKADKGKDSEKITKQTNETGIDCCAFIPVFFDKTRTSDSNQQVAIAAPTTSVVKPRLTAIQTNFAPAFQYFSTVLSKNNTFLKNRTFRI